MKSVREANVVGKRVLLRVDFNVTLGPDGAIENDERIKAAVPTIKFLLEQKPEKIILMTHLGRPEGKVVEAWRTAPLMARLRTYVDAPELEMLENLRFDAREESNDLSFAKELASKGAVYVNDAFAVSHRANASIVGIPTLLPSYAGLLMEREVAKLSEALTPQHPAVAIIGGAKFETKIPLLNKLAAEYDTVLLGGALANDMLKARGTAVGVSLVSDSMVPKALAENELIRIPFDIAVETEGNNAGRLTMSNDVRAHERIVDVGPQTAAAWAAEVAKAKFVVWNGPLGIYEQTYTDATDTLAKALAESNAKAVVGGGDTIAALSKFTFDPERVFVSTGGGAMLEFLADGTLPGIEALKK